MFNDAFGSNGDRNSDLDPARSYSSETGGGTEGPKMDEPDPVVMPVEGSSRTAESADETKEAVLEDGESNLSPAGGGGTEVPDPTQSDGVVMPVKGSSSKEG